MGERLVSSFDLTGNHSVTKLGRPHPNPRRIGTATAMPFLRCQRQFDIVNMRVNLIDPRNMNR